MENSFLVTEEGFRKQPFNAEPVYNDTDFEIRFRLPRSLFLRWKNALYGREVFRWRQTASRKVDILPLVRMKPALHIQAYEKSFDLIYDFIEMSISPAREIFHDFTEETILCFSNNYLRLPNKVDLTQ